MGVGPSWADTATVLRSRMAFSLTKTLVMAATALACGCTPGNDLDDDTNASSTSGDESSGSSGSMTSIDPTVDPSTSSSTDPTVASLDSSSSDDGSMCTQPPVDETTLGQLFIYNPSSSFVPAGAPTQLSLAWIEFGFPTQVEACVAWSIDPVDGVTIDADGLLTVEASVSAGTIVSVTADVEDGRRILTSDFEVYVPLEYEILGYWSEVQQLPCDGGMPFAPEPIIPELVFRDTGEFTVTWTPFETYIDYWGTFTYDEGSGALVLTVEGGNYVPPDVEGEGTATIVDSQLVLEDLWLGVAQNPVTPVACGHVFE
jgi:hypothetical protein